MPAAKFESGRSIAFGSISANYANVGSATTHKARAVLISNGTQGDMWVSLDGGITDAFPVLAGSFVLWDITSNMLAHGEEQYFIEIGSQIAVKQITAPVDKSVYASVLY